MRKGAHPYRRLRSSGVLLSVIVALAAILSVSAYEYANAVESSISSSAVESVHTNAQIQASDIGNLVVAKLQSISTSLQVLSSSTMLNSSDLASAHDLLADAQNTTAAFTYDYTWDSAAGIPIASSNSTTVSAAQRAGVNVSQRTFFVLAKATKTTYFDSSVVSVLNGEQYIVIAQPLYLQDPYPGGQNMTFNGILTAAIRLTALGDFLQSQVSTNFQSSFGMISSSGVILYSANASEIGMDVFGPQIQSLLPASLKVAFDRMVNSSLEGNSGVEVFNTGKVSATLAYQPVVISGGETRNATQGQELGAVYVSSPNTLAAAQAAEIAQLRTIASLIILAIGGSAVVAALVVLRWNWRLDNLVNERTADLEARTVELSQANQQLAARDEAQRDFINVAAHELRTPVQPLLGLTDMMKESIEAGQKGTVELSKFEVDMLARNTRRLETLTNNILDVTRMDAGTLKLNRERFELNAEIRDVVDEVANVVAQRLPSEARFALSGEPLYVDADRTRIFEVVSNLLRNALAFSKGKGIEISTARQGSDALVKVRDYGSGIDPEIMPRLFTKFASKSPSGLGLGLHISKGIVEAHGGRIWAENNTDGKGGASLSFSLPLAQGAAQADEGVGGRGGGASTPSKGAAGGGG